MFITIPGVVKNGVVVPSAPLPEGAQVEIRLSQAPTDIQGESNAGPSLQAGACSASHLAKGDPDRGAPVTRAVLRRMPREQRQAILTAAAALAEQDYHHDKDLTGFEAFSEEELDDDQSDSA
jgi:hypothetical protein